MSVRPFFLPGDGDGSSLAVTIAADVTGVASDSRVVATGALALSTQPGRQWSPLATRLRVASRGNPGAWMDGVVAAYDAASGALTVTIDQTGPALGATADDWSISLSGSPGAIENLATPAETVAGLDTTMATSPAGVAAVFTDKTASIAEQTGATAPAKLVTVEGLHEVANAAVAAGLSSALATAGVMFSTKAALDASLDYPENTVAQVIGDGANDGVYRKIGASGAGSWFKTTSPTNGQLQADFTAQITAVDALADATAAGLAFNSAVTATAEARAALGPAKLPVDSVELERQGLLAPVVLGTQLVAGYDADGYWLGKRRDDGVKWPAVDGPAPALGIVDAGGAFSGVDAAGRLHGDLEPAFSRMGRRPVSPALPDAAFVVADGDGYALSGFGHDGARYDALAAATAHIVTEWLLTDGTRVAPFTALSRESIVAYLPSGERRVLTPFDDYHWRVPQMAYFGRSVRAWRVPIAGGAGEWRAVTIDGDGFSMPDDPDVLHVVYADGQSLAQGSQGGADFVFRGSCFPEHTLTVDNTVLPGDIRLGRDATTYTNALDPNTLGDFVPIMPQQGVSTAHKFTPLEGFMIAMQARIVRKLGRPQRLCGFVMGFGGSTIAQIGVGSQNETNLRATLAHIHAKATALGWRMQVEACLWNHGESNAASTTTTYEADVLAYRSATASYLSSLTGQTAPVKWVLSQASSTAESVDNELTTVAILAFPKMMRDAPTQFRVHGPHYPFQSQYVSGDYVHFLNLGYLRLGEHMAWACGRWMFGGDDPLPVYPVSAVASGATITVTWSQPIDVDAANVPARTFWGVEVSTGTNTFATINSHVVNNGSAVSTITLSASLGSLTNVRLQVAMQAQASPRDAASVPGTNLRASAAIGRSDYDDAPYYAFALHDRIAITGA